MTKILDDHLTEDIITPAQKSNEYQCKTCERNVKVDSNVTSDYFMCECKKLVSFNQTFKWQENSTEELFKKINPAFNIIVSNGT